MYTYKCTVLRILDGDTIDVDIDLGFGVWLHKERVRLHGIDTPESRTRDLEEKKYGLLAKEQIKSFMPVGSMQTLVTMKDKAGKFGRILGKFLIYDKKTDAQMSINDWMVREHHAVEYFGQSKAQIAEGHLKNRDILSGIKRDFLED